MPRLHRLLRVALILPLLGLGQPPAVPKRVVSLNMCADQLLIALADPGQIAALTEWARDPQLSYYADRAKGLPFTHHSAEEVLALRPDLVIGAPFRTKEVLEPLKARGVALVDLAPQESPESAEEAIRTVAAALGHPERGDALIASMRAKLARIGPPPGRGRTVAYYQRQGYLTGTDTLVDAMMRRVGLVNITARLGRPAFSRISLEELVMARPDFVVTEESASASEDRTAAMIRHPLLDRALRPGHHLVIPQALTVCGGPSYPDAVALLAREIRQADRH